MSPQPPHAPSAPAVQRLRIRYAKRGRLRFTSHRDFARAFERALRRAGLPMAYSAGFSPHPKVSYVGAAPTGVASEAEYLEIGLVEACDPAAVREMLDAALPPGLDVLEVVAAAGGSLADRVTGSLWRIALPGVTAEQVAAALEAFLGCESVPVERLTKDGRRTLDPRAAVVLARCELGVPEGGSGADPGGCAIIHVVVRHTTPAVRPDDVLTAFRQVAAFVPPVPPAVTRLAQGLLDDAGRLADPLAPDRTPGGSGPETPTPDIAAAPPR